MKDILVIDNFLDDPDTHREQALKLPYKSYHFEHCTFHGIAFGFPTEVFIRKLTQQFPAFSPVLTFFRKSPQGQEEPHFIHTDVDMGQVSAILYLNPFAPIDDGTAFWTHRETGSVSSDVAHERSLEGKERGNWILREFVTSKFNRLVVFPSSYFHSRRIVENWGTGDDARLTQVTFSQEKPQ